MCVFIVITYAFPSFACEKGFSSFFLKSQDLVFQSEGQNMLKMLERSGFKSIFQRFLIQSLPITLSNILCENYANVFFVFWVP